MKNHLSGHGKKSQIVGKTNTILAVRNHERPFKCCHFPKKKRRIHIEEILRNLEYYHFEKNCSSDTN